jgi:hypothetical protein
LIVAVLLSFLGAEVAAHTADVRPDLTKWITYPTLRLLRGGEDPSEQKDVKRGDKRRIQE